MGHVNARIVFVSVVVVPYHHSLRQVGVGVEVLEKEYSKVLEDTEVGVSGESCDVDRIRFRAKRPVNVPEVLVGEKAFDF